MGWGGVGIGYVRPVQFLDHLTVIKKIGSAVKVQPLYRPGVYLVIIGLGLKCLRLLRDEVLPEVQVVIRKND